MALHTELHTEAWVVSTFLAIWLGQGAKMQWLAEINWGPLLKPGFQWKDHICKAILQIHKADKSKKETDKSSLLVWGDLLKEFTDIYVVLGGHNIVRFLHCSPPDLGLIFWGKHICSERNVWVPTGATDYASYNSAKGCFAGNLQWTHVPT